MTADPRRWKSLAVLGIAYLMVVLDVAIVNVALPSIQTDLDFAPENLQWVGAPATCSGAARSS